MELPYDGGDFKCCQLKPINKLYILSRGQRDPTDPPKHSRLLLTLHNLEVRHHYRRYHISITLNMEMKLS